MSILIRSKQRCVIYVWVVLAILLATIRPLSAQTAISKEYQIEAVFLFNFAQFVTWPPSVFATADEPFRIGVLGDNPFDSFLDEIVHGEKINGHPLVIQHCGAIENAKDCQILFISRSESQRMAIILGDLKDRTILTVGDTEDFIQKGGIICLVKEQNKIHFKINLAAAKTVHLMISSQMLRLADIVELGRS